MSEQDSKSKKWWLLLLLPFVLLIGYFITSYIIVQAETSNIYRIDDEEVAAVADDVHVGIVLGGGVGRDEPSQIVQDRLDTAKELLDRGYVDTLLLSGDNRVEDYNEPQVMYEYLLRQGVEPEQMQRDFAGRSTYETCARAREVFQLQSAFLVSQATHLPRAVYLCRQLGVEAYGIIAESETLKRTFIYQNFREFFARGKTVFNANIIAEEVILGEPIPL